MRSEASGDGMFYRPRALMQAQAYADLGNQRQAGVHFRRARAQIAESLAVYPTRPTLLSALGFALAGLGQRTRAISIADSAMALADAPAATPYATGITGEAAEIRARVGDVDGALALLERLLAMPAGREASVASLRVDPVWDPLRADPRFERMLRRFAAR